MKAVVNRIIPNTFIDGPGSRMAIFLQGCNMKCLYCHNPETQSLCCSCGHCVGNCPAGALAIVEEKVVYNKKACCSCDRCIRSCPYHASPKCVELDLDRLFELVQVNADFIDGITLSGGECSLQHELIYALFSKVRSQTSLNCFIDTNGYVNQDVFQRLCEVTDGFMFDLKAFGKEKHLRLTGLDNGLIFSNMAYASKKERLYEIRTVIVPGFTDTEEEIRAIAEHIRELNSNSFFRLIPFRPMGVRTYMSEFEVLSKETFEHLYEIAYNILGSRVIKTE